MKLFWSNTHRRRRDNWCVVAWWKADNPVWHSLSFSAEGAPVTRVEGAVIFSHMKVTKPHRAGCHLQVRDCGQMSLKLEMYSCDMFLQQHLRTVP